MARISTAELSRYLLSGQLSRRACLRTPYRTIPLLPRQSSITCRQYATSPSTTAPSSEPIVPLRKKLKDASKALKKATDASNSKKKPPDNQTVPGWELTVGIEIHAQLNTPRKLFSTSTTPTTTTRVDASPPNTHVSPFDVAIPGSQPIFQPLTLVPAIRAALALGCNIQNVSRFDRKHYFHWDQPAGYQITQYFEPFARDGGLQLLARDGIAKEDGKSILVGVQRVQMEQDTGKTVVQPASGKSNAVEDEEGVVTHWVDFNRVGLPLIEIITEPVIHHPATAAAFVKKVQMLLYAVNACVSGMESGGLRADVNVSVRREGEEGLGTRTEIKNLSSFKAVEDAIIAERDRQIKVLEGGGVVEGETRGWTLGSSETRRLRGKEGEVDYRYMPDPDLGPVVVDEGLVRYLGETMGTLPDREIDGLVEKYGLSTKDAMALVGLDDGARVQYFYYVLDALEARLGLKEVGGLVGGESGEMNEREQEHALLAANWCLHELGKLTEVSSDLEMTPLGECAVPSADLADILAHLYKREITARVAKELLWGVFRGEIQPDTVTETIESEGLWFQELSEEEYTELADEVVDKEEKVVGEFVKFAEGTGKGKGYPQGKLMFLVGQMMRAGPEQRMDPTSAEKVMKRRMEEVYVPRALGKMDGEE